MGNVIDLPNITPESIVIDGGSPQEPVSKGSFDVKNYLNVRLDKGEEEKTLTIRLLPMDLTTGNPFVKIHVHNVQVPKELVSEGQKPYKSFICLHNNKDIDHERYGDKCPYCELNYNAYVESTKATDPIEKKSWQKISLQNKSEEAVIVRCIERGKENEGVKFWKFNIRDDKTDPYNQILKLWTLRKESAEKKGEVNNILDIYNGRDLNVTITKEGTSAPQIVDDSDRSPLSKDENQMREWIFDKKKWQDVFTCKPYDYLKLVSEMRVPWFDKKAEKWVDKEEYEAAHKSQKNESNEELKNAEAKIVEMANSVEYESKPEQKSEKTFAQSITINEESEDLPF
jgi:hypothetical protein